MLSNLLYIKEYQLYLFKKTVKQIYILETRYSVYGDLFCSYGRLL